MVAMRARYWLGVLMVVCACAYLLCFNGLQVGQHVDDASYVMLAQSLLSGRGYSQIAYPGAPPEVKYPPLLPLLMVPFVGLFHGALWATRLPALLCALAGIPLLYLLLRRFVQGPALWLLVALSSLHPLVVGYAGMAMTEAPSLLLTWAILLLTLEYEGSGRLRQWLLVGVLLALGLLLRTDMLALLAAVVVVLLMRRKWAPVGLVLVVALLPAVLWHLHGVALGGGGGYVQELGAGWWDRSPLPLRMWHGLCGYLGDYIPQLVGLVFGSAVEQAAAAHGVGLLATGLKWALGLLVLLGFVLSWRRLPLLITLFVAVRMGMLTLWPVVSRYLLPMLPFLFLYVPVTLSWRKRPEGQAFSPRIAAIIFALLLLPALGRDALLVLKPPSRDYPDLVAGGRLIADHTPPDAVVLSTWSAKSFYLYSHRLAREMPPPTTTLYPIHVLAAAQDSDYLLLVPAENVYPIVTEFDSNPALRRVADVETNPAAPENARKLILYQFVKPLPRQEPPPPRPNLSQSSRPRRGVI